MSRHDSSRTLREARAAYFVANDFGDGGYEDRWVRLKIGPLPVRFPNFEMRVRAVRYHDLHHVLTEYDTDVLGEAEIGAWELASGCSDYPAALALNLYAVTLGLLRAPAAVRRAFVRGRYARNLYGTTLDDQILDMTVGEWRERLGLAAPPPAPSRADGRAFVRWAGLSVLLTLVSWTWPLVLAIVILRAWL